MYRSAGIVQVLFVYICRSFFFGRQQKCAAMNTYPVGDGFLKILFNIIHFMFMSNKETYSFNERETCHISVILVFINVLDGWMGGWRNPSILDLISVEVTVRNVFDWYIS